MLKYVHLILSEPYYQKIVHNLTTLQKDFSNHEVKLLINDSLYENQEETLYIADQEQILMQLQNQGAFVVALYHEDNRQQNLSGTLYGIEKVEQLEYESFDEIYRRLAGLPWKILQTKRMRVRESTEGDIEHFYRIYAHPSITKYIENLFPAPEQEQAYMEDYIKQVYGFYGYGLWTLLLKETETVIGRAGLSVRAGYETPELGFVIDNDYQRQGYAYEVCQAILKYAKDHLCFEQVHALADEKNEASILLLQKLGFRYEKEVWEQNKRYNKYIITF